MKIHKKSLILFLVIALIAILVISLRMYGYNKNKEAVQTSNSVVSSDEEDMPIQSIGGDYDAEQGTGEIHIDTLDSSHVLIEGHVLYPGPGNSANEKTMEAHTGKIKGSVMMQKNMGTYTDSADPSCKLIFVFSKKGMTVSGGYHTCDALIAIFDGNYEKRGAN